MSVRTLSLALLAGVMVAPAAGATRPASSPASRAASRATTAPASASAPAAPRARVALATNIEDHKKMLRATVTADGKPLENVTVAFYVKRTFGNLLLGTDQTLDDGTAAVAFPLDLPGGRTGRLEAFAQIQSPEKYAGPAGEATLEGGAIVPAEADPFPRALWAPRAPLALIATILGLLAAVWVAYAYVVVQLLRIGKKGNAT